jgi:aspartyl-tRNA(Asn)/glutamyl-tRNA(Gln) amidotransferase subunit A
MNIREAGRLLRSRKLSCTELLEQSLASIETHNTELNAFITITAYEARLQAKLLDTELANGRDRGPLHGIPIAVKDLFYSAGIRTTNGSAVFRDFVPDYDATVMRKLETAGAVCVGKLNQHECAYGITSTNPHFGAVRNPRNHDCIPGGSSGGSGAAVASGMVFMAMGSDTGGSIRIPASYCGTVGLKPTFGRVSRYGCFPLGLTLDHMGPLTRNVEDAAIVLEAIAGADPHDESTAPAAHRTFTANIDEDITGLRVGVPANFFLSNVELDVRRGVERAISAAEAAGAVIQEVHVPDPAGLNTVARLILLAEASAVMEPYLHRRKDFGADVLALFDSGRFVSATDYVNAQRVRRRMQREWEGLFRTIDVLFTPTTPITAPKIGATTVMVNDVEEDARLASTRLVRGINALGLPAISMPCGQASSGLPISLQLIGRAWQEKTILNAAAALEREGI